MSQPKPPLRPAPGQQANVPARPAVAASRTAPGNAKPTVAAPQVASNTAKPGGAQPSATGKVVHDDRGNAVWDWLKETSRIAIESTTRLLRKLESPELKVEDTHDEELRIMPDPGKCAGGGYDPYNQANKSRKPGK
jgi:hypothetical protein